MPFITCAGAELLLLRGSHAEMGYEHGRLLASAIQGLVKAYVHNCQKAFGFTYDQLLKSVKAYEPYVPEPYVDEMSALAAASNVVYRDILALNSLPDLVSAHKREYLHCCNFVVASPCAVEGLFLHGRNLDFLPLGKLGVCTSVCIVRLPNQATYMPTISVTHAGFCSTYTCVNASKLTIAEVGTPSKFDGHPGVPIGLAMRYVAERGHSIGDAVQMLENFQYASGYNLALSDGKSLESVAVELTPKQFGTRKPRRGYLVVDDVCLCRDTGRNRLVHPAGAFRFARMVQLINENFGKIDEKVAMSFLKDRYDLSAGRISGRGYNCICNDHTVHSVLMYPSQSKLLVSHTDLPAPLGNYFEIDLSQFW